MSTIRPLGCNAVFCLCFGVCFSATAQTGGAVPVHSPEVVHTGIAPTGYTVTFRYEDAAAKNVRIKGEWSFERPSELTALAPTPDHPVVEGQGISPSNWKPGDVPLQHPNSTGPNFPVEAMQRDAAGVWTYTTPLPSGVFTYSFLVNCSDADLTGRAEQPAPDTGCKTVADPANPSWAIREGIHDAPVVSNSQVYVPSDPHFRTADFSWQAPVSSRGWAEGRLHYVSYASPGHISPKDRNGLVVYTPPDYDAHRARPYPTLYLSHGGGENEMGWSTQGNVRNILDNLIGTGDIQPMIVVMPNGGGFPASNGNEAYDRDLAEHMVPLVEQQFHVSHASTDRAFSGLSMGGMLTNSFILRHPQMFGYFGVMSAGLPPANAILTPDQIANLRGKVLWLGAGWQDVIFAAGFRTMHLGPARDVTSFANAGLPLATDFIDGGHEWYVWRILLRDFLTRVAFRPQPYAAWQ